MAAIVGYIAEPHSTIDVEHGWRAARESLRERSPLEAIDHVLPAGRVAFRGHPDQQHVTADGISAFIDGRIENLTRLAERFALASADNSDAWTLAQLFGQVGEPLLAELEGSFALAVIDHQRGQLFLVRDRFGSRPLFFARMEHGWAWASECRMLLPLLRTPHVDVGGLAESFYYKWLVGDRTLFEGIEQVLTSSVVTLRATDARSQPRRYWRPEFAPAAPTAPMSDWVDRTDAALHTYCDRVLRPGMKVAVLLSGGTDSSLLAQYVSQHTENCVLVTPTWADYDDPEVPRARAYAELLGREHRVHVFDQSAVRTLFPYVVSRLEQPSRNFHALTLAALMPLLQEFDGVVYGEAADTMFGPFASIYVRQFAQKWRFLRPAAGLLNAIVRRLPQHRRVRDFRRLTERSPAQIIRQTGLLDHPDFVLARLNAIGASREPNPAVTRSFLREDFQLGERTQSFTLATDVTCHMECVDRLSAPLGVEFLTPFLSPEIVDVALALPAEYKSDERGAKPVLKTLARRYFPEALVYARKLGFPAPTERWLQNELAQRLADLRTSPMGELLGMSVVSALDPVEHLEAAWISISMDEVIEQFSLDMGPLSTLQRA